MTVRWSPEAAEDFAAIVKPVIFAAFVDRVCCLCLKRAGTPASIDKALQDGRVPI
jgi:hypothetical protein